MTKPNDPEWSKFQRKVAALFRRIPGCKAYTDYAIEGVRGIVNVDVFVEIAPLLQKASNPLNENLVFRVIVECKCWKRKVPQEKVFLLREIVSDTGAALGILVTEKGVQEGAKKYIQNKSGLVAMTFRELESMIMGMEVARVFVRRELHPSCCTDCGRAIKIPFLPPVFCEDCYRKRCPL